MCMCVCLCASASVDTRKHVCVCVCVKGKRAFGYKWTYTDVYPTHCTLNQLVCTLCWMDLLQIRDELDQWIDKTCVRMYRMLHACNYTIGTSIPGMV